MVGVVSVSASKSRNPEREFEQEIENLEGEREGGEKERGRWDRDTKREYQTWGEGWAMGHIYIHRAK